MNNTSFGHFSIAFRSHRRVDSFWCLLRKVWVKAFVSPLQIFHRSQSSFAAKPLAQFRLKLKLLVSKAYGTQSKMPNVLFGINGSEFMKNGGFKEVIVRSSSFKIALASIFFFVWKVFTDEIEELIIA